MTYLIALKNKNITLTLAVTDFQLNMQYLMSLASFALGKKFTKYIYMREIYDYINYVIRYVYYWLNIPACA